MLITESRLKKLIHDLLLEKVSFSEFLDTVDVAKYRLLVKAIGFENLYATQYARENIPLSVRGVCKFLALDTSLWNEGMMNDKEKSVLYKFCKELDEKNPDKDVIHVNYDDYSTLGAEGSIQGDSPDVILNNISLFLGRFSIRRTDNGYLITDNYDFATYKNGVEKVDIYGKKGSTFFAPITQGIGTFFELLGRGPYGRKANPGFAEFEETLAGATDPMSFLRAYTENLQKYGGFKPYEVKIRIGKRYAD